MPKEPLKTLRGCLQNIFQKKKLIGVFTLTLPFEQKKVSQGVSEEENHYDFFTHYDHHKNIVFAF